jgi:uncharacterized protein (DUF1778 family)
MYGLWVATKTERLNLRLTQAQDEVLRRAADAQGESMSEYVLRHAIEAAEMDLADRRLFVVDDDTWNELQAVLDRPAVLNPKLAKLLADPSVLEQR